MLRLLNLVLFAALVKGARELRTGDSLVRSSVLLFNDHGLHWCYKTPLTVVP